MRDRVKKYIDKLFTEVYDTKQLLELKEEISANLMEKINDYIASGESKDTAFQKAVSSLGDMGELVDSLKKASEEKMQEEMFKSQPIGKKHAIGYTVASAILLIGLMLAGFQNNLYAATEILMPFFVVSVGYFVYFGLTQESAHEYGMKGKRAFMYSLASAILVTGIFVSLTYYLDLTTPLLSVLVIFSPFFIIAAIMFIYLGLTEKSRMKPGKQWQEHWVNYYKNPKAMMLRGNLSGALWIFTFAAFLFIGFTWSWMYALIVFIVAVGMEVLIEAIFAAKSQSHS